MPNTEQQTGYPGAGFGVHVERIFHTQRSPQHEEVIDFLNSHVRSTANFSIQEEYPSLFGEFPGGESYVIRVNHRIVSHVGSVIRNFIHPHFQMKIGLLGSVVTSEEFRRRGFAKVLLKTAMLEQKQNRCIISVLWSDRTDLYSSLGFYRAGQERDLSFSESSVPPGGSPPIEYRTKDHAHLVWRLYQKNEMRLDRSLEEQKQLCTIPKTRLFVTQKEGVVTSYLAIHKGMDFENYIHEWGGDLNELGRSIAWIQKHLYPQNELTLIAPANRDLRCLKNISKAVWDGVLGLVNVLDASLLLKIYCTYLKKTGIDFKIESRSSQLRARAIITSRLGHRISGSPLNAPHSQNPRHIDGYASDFAPSDRSNLTPTCAPKREVIIARALRVEKVIFPLTTQVEYLNVILGSEGVTPHECLPFFLWGFDSI